jgi:hypothetical protein
MKNNKTFWTPLILFLLIVTACVFLRNKSAEWGWDFDVIMAGTSIIFVASALSSWILQKSLGSSNPQAFVRAMYGSFMLKFFVLVLAAFVYIMIEKKQVNKPALFTCLGLYLVFTFLEVSAMTKLLKQKKNA